MPSRTPPLTGTMILTALAGCWLAGCAERPAQASSLVAVDYAALVARADLDFRAQLGPGGPAPGLPIGNGRMGTLLWTGKGPGQPRLSMLINHTDVFAFRGSSESTRDAHHAYANGCGAVDVDFGGGVFGEASTANRLTVHDALATVSGAGVRVRALAWHRHDVIALEIVDERPDPKPIAVELRMLRPAVDRSGPHTATTALAADGGDIELTQEFREKASRATALDLNSFTSMRARVLGRAVRAGRPDGERIRLTAPAARGTLTVLISLGQSKEEPLAAVRGSAKSDLERAASLGFERLLEDNRSYWHEFWSRSFIRVSGSPEGEEMTRFYLWGLYLAGSCQRGNFPAKHNGLIFVTQDNRQWGGPFWWFNESAQQGWQWQANHAELAEPVFRWHERNIAAYANAARRSWNSRGRYVPETSAWDGPEILPEGAFKPEGRRTQYHLSSLGGGYTARNTYNMAKFAALYYEKYLYTGDEAWLRDRVYPAARATAEFYCGLKAGCRYAGGADNGPEGQAILRKDADGRYHLYGTILHEHIWWGKDIIEDLAAIRGVFPLAILLSRKYGVDEARRGEWQEVLDNLAPYPRSETPGAIGSLGAGTWAQGLPPHGNVRDNFGDESPRMGPVVGDFLDVLTLESPDAKEWGVAMATLDKHPGTGARPLCSCGSYAVLPSRMGRADLVRSALPRQVASSAGQSGPGASESLQGPGIFARAIQQALLLCVSPTPAGEPVIRVMDGWPRAWDVAFRLQAKGGFLVSSAMKGGTIRFVEVLSQRGGPCRIRNPWPGSQVSLLCDGRTLAVTKESLLKFPTEQGKTYLLVSPACWNPQATGLGKIEELKTSVP